MATTAGKTKYHISADGTANPCPARKQCRLKSADGETVPHAMFDNPQDAQRWAESVLAEHSALEGNPHMRPNVRRDLAGVARRVRRRMTTQEKKITSDHAKAVEDHLRKRALVGELHVDKKKNDAALKTLVSALGYADTRKNKNLIDHLGNAIVAPPQGHKLPNGRSISTTQFLQAEADVKQYDANRDATLAAASAWAQKNMAPGEKKQIRTENGLYSLTAKSKLDEEALSKHPRYAEMLSEKPKFDSDGFRAAVGEKAYMELSKPYDKIDTIKGSPMTPNVRSLKIGKDATLEEAVSKFDSLNSEIRAQYGTVKELKNRESASKTALKESANAYAEKGRPVVFAAQSSANAVVKSEGRRADMTAIKERFTPEQLAPFQVTEKTLDPEKVASILSADELSKVNRTVVEMRFTEAK